MDSQKHTILIVDDDEEIIFMLKDYFRKRNFAVIATADPVTVVEKLRNFSVKLMLLDIKMRKLDGFGVLTKIKQAGITLPPTIIITGFYSKYQEQLLEYGLEERDVLTKPFHFADIETHIERKLGNEVSLEEVDLEDEEKAYENNRCRIGVVEDEQDIREILVELFEEKSYTVDCYGNGKVALESLKDKPVDILIVDIKLPGLTGDRLITELKKQSISSYIIPISGELRIENQIKALGCQDFFSKPFDLDALARRVGEIARTKGLLG